ncbi:acyl--CoA ligase [Planomonospora sp. ID67723]|uniref:class I adenylate-forming enzyme family protein n=1 Tax=Planomonospora sp. ID67723 TaxID=2738134 RepID=UPI0018C43799|nr:class I adenylate-forming enzyme family protein [Planomonospora sp. ID67723]MBG0828842.1 acyl--CoA ligase [Planomonospora sp. ID67723]
MVNLTVIQLLRDRALADPEGVALIVQGSAPLTYGQWDERSTELANGLVERGVVRGDRVGLVFGNGDWTDYAVAFFGVLKAGAAAVPLSDRLAPADLRFMLGHCGAVGAVHAEGLDVPVQGWSATPGGLRARALAETSYEKAAEKTAPGPGDLAQILYTSGTTGRPKGVSATHANLVHGCGGKRRPFAHSRHLVHAFPVGSNAGQTMLINALDAHPAVVTLPRFTPGRFAALIESYRAGTVFLVPAMAIELINAGVAERHDLSSVLLLGSAAAPLPSAVAGALTGAFPNAMIANYYTSTEAAPAQTIMMFDPERPGSVGRAVAGGQVRIATPQGEPLPQGETGEVWMRSPAAPRSYYGDPASGTFRDGWIRMGDLGYLDPDGYLYLVDRESDVVKSGAYKVSTLHVEEAVFEHPAVVEAAAFGVPHPVLGTVVAVAMTVREPLAAEELRVFLAGRLAPQELPARVVTVPALPRNAGGKVDKRALREAIA